MVFPGIIRRVNKTLPALLQTIVIICLLHFLTQGILTKINKKFHLSRYSHSDATTQRSMGRASTRIGGGFSRRPRPARGRSSSTSTTTTTTTTTTTPLPPPPDDVMEQEHQRRLETLHTACARWNLGLWSSNKSTNISADVMATLATMPKSPLYQALLVSEKHHLAVCPAARNGIQWLARRLLRLTGRFEEHQLHRLHEPPAAIARHNFPYLSSWEKYPIVLAKSLTILMARHPFDRLLASYRHILEDPEKNPHGYLHYGRRIVRTYRQAPGHGKGPTFEEFVRFLLAHDTHHLEDAWQPTMRRCTPCHIGYNMVTKYETLWNDVQWAWKRAGFGTLNTTDYVVYTLTPEIRRQYFSELTLTQVLELFKKYKMDFQLYGYTLEEHMAYAKPGEEAIDPALLVDIPRVSPYHLQDVQEQSQEQALLKVDHENTGREQVPYPEPDSSNTGLALTGERHAAVEVSNDIEPPKDNWQFQNGARAS
ncbi:carbohydrate sulfotransferase 10 [Procambarus clarkii]|uniref:carbohydrate sulfotransferase 10 n=1 Tax=Procambarus clarkii TaxID=6728 RepID=UPI001E67617E|nr:carbohydrate sulfotransferase 10-like [Procambarus clarkii]XP_045586059.1 carbohydrate sulfotransferase 10-like [Procambarus clarkii]